jgi:hypothetical protein
MASEERTVPELLVRVAELERVIAGVVSAHAGVETTNMPEWLEAAEGALREGDKGLTN